MRDTALYREWRHGWSLQPPRPFVASTRRLYHELPPDILSLVSIGPVIVERDSFQIDERGEWAFLTPVCHIDGDLWRLLVWDCGFEPEAVWRVNAEVIDIVAWHPATPGRWARRTGVADMLGEIAAAEALRVHQTPYGWLRASGAGICFLDHQRASVASALRLTEKIVADNPAHARELRDICARPWPIPSIGVAA